MSIINTLDGIKKELSKKTKKKEVKIDGIFEEKEKRKKHMPSESGLRGKVVVPRLSSFVHAYYSLSPSGKTVTKGAKNSKMELESRSEYAKRFYNDLKRSSDVNSDDKIFQWVKAAATEPKKFDAMVRKSGEYDDQIMKLGWHDKSDSGKKDSDKKEVNEDVARLYEKMREASQYRGGLKSFMTKVIDAVRDNDELADRLHENMNSVMGIMIAEGIISEEVLRPDTDAINEECKCKKKTLKEGKKRRYKLPPVNRDRKTIDDLADISDNAYDEFNSEFEDQSDIDPYMKDPSSIRNVTKLRDISSKSDERFDMDTIGVAGKGIRYSDSPSSNNSLRLSRMPLITFIKGYYSKPIIPDNKPYNRKSGDFKPETRQEFARRVLKDAVKTMTSGKGSTDKDFLKLLKMAAVDPVRFEEELETNIRFKKYKNLIPD